MSDELVTISKQEYDAYLRLENACNALVEAMPNCSCGPEYADRGLSDPDCCNCELQPQWGVLVDALKAVA